MRWEDRPGDLLLMKCTAVWSEAHAKSCQDWILAPKRRTEDLDTDRMVQFLVTTSEQQSVHISSFERSVGLNRDFWMDKKECLGDAVQLVLECLGNSPDEPSGRNALQPWLQLLLLIAQRGKNQTNYLIASLVSAVEDFKGEEASQSLVRSTILRLYAYFPDYVNLGNAQVRTTLIEACKASTEWLTWRCPRDSQMDDMLATLKTNYSQRLTQALVDLSKSHPLLVLRKFRTVAALLDDDASSVHTNRNNDRNRVQGEYLSSPAQAKVGDRIVKVAIRHWGYAFTDPLWVSVVEILLSIPHEVLFSCGLGSGLEDLLGVYVKLLFVQSQLRNRDRAARVKGRFSDLIGIFESNEGWDKWLASKVPGLPSLGKMRNILISCSLITTEQAMENIRSKKK